MNQHSDWTADEKAALRQMRAEGKSLSMIAATVKKTRNACAGMAHRLGLALPPGRVRDRQVSPRLCRPPKPVRPPRLVAVKPRPATPAPPPVVSLAYARPFMSRASRECAWMLDDGRSCCAAVVGRGSYCAGHAALVYAPTKRLAVEKTARKYA